VRLVGIAQHSGALAGRDALEGEPQRRLDDTGAVEVAGPHGGRAHAAGGVRVLPHAGDRRAGRRLAPIVGQRHVLAHRLVDGPVHVEVVHEDEARACRLGAGDHALHGGRPALGPAGVVETDTAVDHRRTVTDATRLIGIRDVRRRSLHSGDRRLPRAADDSHGALLADAARGERPADRAGAQDHLQVLGWHLGAPFRGG
jgi:hypothetical protein